MRSRPSETNYVIKGELTTAEGYPLSLDVSIYGVTQPEEPGDAIVFTSISQAYAEADATGWAINYSVEFENDEWQAAFEFCNDGGTGSQIPAYKYLYSSYVESGTGCVTQYRIVNKKTSETLTLDEGSVTVAYADGVYDIDFDLMQTNGQHFKASYDGPIELDDYTSMGGGGYAR